MLALSKSLVYYKFFDFKCTSGWVDVSPNMSQRFLIKHGFVENFCVALKHKMPSIDYMKDIKKLKNL